MHGVQCARAAHTGIMMHGAIAPLPVAGCPRFRHGMSTDGAGGDGNLKEGAEVDTTQGSSDRKNHGRKGPPGTNEPKGQIGVMVKVHRQVG